MNFAQRVTEAVEVPASLQTGSEAVVPNLPKNGNAFRTVHMAWFCNLIDAQELVRFDASLGLLSNQQLERLVARLGPTIGSIALPPAPISLGRQRLCLHPVLIPQTSALMKQALDSRQLEIPRRLLKQAMEIAVRLDCEVVSLGQYTSILSHNGRFLSRLRPAGMGLTTGNSYTVSLALQAVERVLARQHRRAPNETLMVAGALGNIGSICVHLLAPRYQRVLLLGSGRPGSMARLQTLADTLPNAEATTDPERAVEAGVVIAASSGVDALLHPGNLAKHAIICDVSIPSAVHADVPRQRPDVTVLRGGLAQLPGQEDLAIQNFPLPPGQVFGCMAEGLLLAAEGVRDDDFTGTITPAHVRRVEAMAERHGVTLANLHTEQLFGGSIV